jgi:hypothetical protein
VVASRPSERRYRHGLYCPDRKPARAFHAAPEPRGEPLARIVQAETFVKATFADIAQSSIGICTRSPLPE